MRHATGPGQIEFPLKTVAAASDTPAQTALLFNFDIDDATVKQQHRDWLDANVVQRLKLNPIGRVQMQGTTSRSGANSYNLELSRRRVAAVKAYLVSRGVRPDQVDTSFAGEELSVSASPEDPRDRAVAVILEAVPLPPVSFVELTPLTGFDPPGDPRLQLPRQTLAVGGSARLGLVNAPVVGLLVSQNPAIATVRPTRPPIVGQITVFGTGPGTTVVEAWDESHTVLLAELEVVVKPRVVHVIAFHVVRDSATPPHFSQRSSGNIRQLFDAMNNVYIPQANVSFLWNGVVNVITVPIDLGAKVETPTEPKSQEWTEIVNRGDPAAPLRVFYVHDFDFTDSEKEELGGAESIPGRDAMMGDDTPLNLETKVLAHEVGHLLGLFHVDDPNQLMGTNRVIAGLRLSRTEADRLNPGVPMPSPRPRVQRR